MFRGYNFTVSDDRFADYVAVGNRYFQSDRNLVRETLAGFTDSSGKLQAAQMTANWFPDIKADVFISHSHKDSDVAIGLAGYLKKEFGITSFIDSAAWGYSDDLIHLIDEEYCYNKGKETFNYHKRNRSTAHVYMMLSVAISQMINRCECLMFLNTPQSITSEKSVSTSTESPWIYAEIAMTTLIEQRPAHAHRVTKGEGITENLAADSMTVQFDVELDHLVKMTERQFNKWAENAPRNGRYAALSSLYETVA